MFLLITNMQKNKTKRQDKVRICDLDCGIHRKKQSFSFNT